MTKATREALQDVVRILHEAGWDEHGAATGAVASPCQGRWLFAADPPDRQGKWVLSIQLRDDSVAAPQVQVIVEHEGTGTNGTAPHENGCTLQGEAAQKLLALLSRVPKQAL